MSAEIEIDTTAAFPPGAGLGAEWRKSLGHISSLGQRDLGEQE